MQIVKSKKLSVSELRIRRNMIILITVFFVYTLAGGEFNGTTKIQSISMTLKTPENLIFLLWMMLVYYSWQFRMVIGDHWADFDIESKNMVRIDEKFKNIFIKHASQFIHGFSNKKVSEYMNINRRLFWYSFEHHSETGNGFPSQFRFSVLIYTKEFWSILKIDLSNVTKNWISNKYVSDYYFPYLYLIVVAFYILLDKVL